MSRRSTGVCLLAIAAFLYAARHLAAAIFGSGVASWSGELYQSMLNYVGADLWILSAIAALAGIGYLVAAEMQERRRGQ